MIKLFHVQSLENLKKTIQYGALGPKNHSSQFRVQTQTTQINMINHDGLLA